MVHMDLMKAAPPSPENTRNSEKIETRAITPSQPNVDDNSDGDSVIVGVKVPANPPVPEPAPDQPESRYPRRHRSRVVSYQHVP